MNIEAQHASTTSTETNGFITLVLQRFLSTHLQRDVCMEIDDIIVEYLVAVIQDVGQLFDLDDFLEMMTAYIPGFEVINDVIVTGTNPL